MNEKKVAMFIFYHFSQIPEEEDVNVSIKRDFLKGESPLHRAQSLKVVETSSNQIFRPSDLVIGECIGDGFFGEVIKVWILFRDFL